MPPLGGNLAELLDTPIRPGVGRRRSTFATSATIENGTDIVTAYAHVNGKRTVYIPVTKRADASTLAVINRVEGAIPRFKKVVARRCRRRAWSSTSPATSPTRSGAWSTKACSGALLTGLMVLLFLRDWRSALIVVLNIPFALLAAVVLLWAHGPDDQHHDARRPRARRRRPGG